MTGYISSFICNLLTLPYPIFASYKAVESTTKVDDTQWLIFWVVWGSSTLIESMVSVVIFWFPFYFEIKLLFFTLLQLPVIGISERMYEKILKPYFDSKMEYIDGILLSLKRIIFDWLGVVTVSNQSSHS